MAAAASEHIRWCGQITERYIPPAPRDLPELRVKLGHWLEQTGPGFYLANALIGRQQLPHGLPADAGAAHVAVQERRRVMAGELYWVSAAMTGLARHAAPGLPSWHLYPHDVPSQHGLMVFETPLASYRNDLGRQVEIVAASWGPWHGPAGGWPGGGLYLTFYSHPAPLLPLGAFGHGAGKLEWAGLAAQAPPVLPDNEAGWPFGRLEVIPSRVNGTTAGWARVLRAAWRLMQQPLTEQTRERAPRAARRRLARAGQAAPDVRVVHVRRREHGTARDGGETVDRHYSCQWWVNGHWRTYWCGPGRHRPEDRWISPYLAGPDDKPVRGVERVRLWDR